MNQALFALLAVGLACSLISCGGEGSNSINDVTVKIDPSETNVVVGGSKAFKATVSNANTQNVTWSVQEQGGGTIDADTGTYKAPNTAGTYHVMAESYANPLKSAVATVHVVPKGTGHGLTNILFVHSELGLNMIKEAAIRTAVSDYNKANTAAYEFWDHGTNAQGLTDSAGKATGTNYGVPSDNLTPGGQASLWTSIDAGAAACRDQILANHEVIVIQPPATSSNIADATALTAAENAYTAIRNYADMHTDKLFILMTPPPQHRLETTKAKALNARVLASFVAGTDFLNGHPNVKCYNLFDALAEQNGVSATANMLRYDFERSHTTANSLPTSAACKSLGKVFIEAVLFNTKSY